MKKVELVISSIKNASDNNNLIELVKIHDNLLSEDISIVEKVLSTLRDDFQIEYFVFSEASKISKVEKNGVFNKIIKQTLLRDKLNSIE